MAKEAAKQLLAKALEELLQYKNIDSISVSEIVTAAGLSRKTFYRNFCDKFALTDYCFSEFFERSFGLIASGKDWDSAMLCYLELCERKSSVLKNAYASADTNSLKKYDIEITRKTYEKYLLKQGAAVDSAEMRFAIEIAARGGTDMIIRWISGQIAADRFQMKELLKRTLPPDLLVFLRSESK